MNIRDYNRAAWDREVERGNIWTVPVSAAEVARARDGDWQVLLTPTRPVPREWFPPLDGTRVLCLASGGGQQGPILAAAGAKVTVVDNSPAQLAQDRLVAERDGLAITLIEGDMADLHGLLSGSFDLIVQPVSNCFVPDVLPVWRESFRVLREGGAMLAGFCNPVIYIFDLAASERGELVVNQKIPYSDCDDLPAAQLKALMAENEPLSFGHSLDDLIGGQLAAGFVVAGFFEDHWRRENREPIDDYMATFIATRAVKPSRLMAG